MKKLLKILVIEDDAAVSELIKVVLTQQNFECVLAATLKMANLQLIEHSPDLVILDWMLPDGQGIDWLKKIKQAEFGKNLPIIMLTARAELNDKLKGFELGADDYLSKPFSPKELLARINVALRHFKKSKDSVILYDDIAIDPLTNKVKIAGKLVEIAQSEYKMLYFFITHPDTVYSRESLINHIWGLNSYIDERTIDVHIKRLRKVLAPFDLADHIQTIRGVGYSFSNPHL